MTCILLALALGMGADPVPQLNFKPYDDFPEPWKARLIDSYKAEVDKRKSEVEKWRGLARTAKTVKGQNAAVAKRDYAKEQWLISFKNDPPWLQVPHHAASRWLWGWKIDDYGYSGQVKIFQVLPPKRLLVGNDTYGIKAMLELPNVVGLTDGSDYQPIGIFEAVDTVTYRTAGGGTKTVILVKSVDLKSFIKKNTARADE